SSSFHSPTGMAASSGPPHFTQVLKCAIVVLVADRLVGLDENLRSAWVQLALDALDDPIRRPRRHGALERDDLDAVVGEEHLPALVGGGDRRRDGGPILLGGSD